MKDGSDQEEEVDGFKAIIFRHPMRSAIKAITALTQPLSPLPKILNLCVRSDRAAAHSIHEAQHTSSEKVIIWSQTSIVNDATPTYYSQDAVGNHSGTHKCVGRTCVSTL
jgi:hypothetical protein